MVNLRERLERQLGPSGEDARPIDAGGGGPHPPGMDIGERLAKLESGQDWLKIILTLIVAVVVGGFALLGVQINRIDTKVDALGARIDAQGAQTRQELTGIANAIANSITATRQVQPQIMILPAPTPGGSSANPPKE